MNVTCLTCGKTLQERDGQWRDRFGTGSAQCSKRDGGHRPAIWLVGFGLFQAKRAEDLVVGERRVYNYGTSAEIIRIAPRGATYLNLTVRPDGSDEEITRTIRRTTMIAYRSRRDL